MINAKIKVTKEVAEAIEFLRKDYNYGFAEFMQVRCNGKFHSIRRAFPLNDVPAERLANALINGYEIEKTPAEEVAYYYESKRLFCYATDSFYERGAAIGEMRGIEFVAEAYGLKIEGVNA